MSQNFGADKISVYLLEDNNKDHKINTLHGIDHENKDRARNGSHIRAKKRDHIGNSNNDADKQRIWHFHHAGSGKADHSNNCRINDLAADKANEGVAGKTNIFDKLIGCFLAQNGVGDLFALRRKIFLAEKKVDCNDETDQKIPQDLYKTDHA